MESRLYKGVTSWLFFFCFNFLHFFHFNECIFEWIESKKKKNNKIVHQNDEKIKVSSISMQLKYMFCSCPIHVCTSECKMKTSFFFYFSNSCSTKNLFVCRKLDLCFFFSHFQIVQLKTWFSHNYHYVHGNRAWNTVCRIYVHVVVVVVVKSFVVVRLFCFYVELFCVHHRHLPPMMRIVVIFIYLRSFFFYSHSH